MISFIIPLNIDEFHFRLETIQRLNRIDSGFKNTFIIFSFKSLLDFNFLSLAPSFELVGANVLTLFECLATTFTFLASTRARDLT